MLKDYYILKKKYGEDFAKFCRTMFPTILEQEGLLADIITSHFAPSRSLYHDILNNQEREFINYIYGLFNQQTQPNETIDQTPQQLMQKAGYTLYKCETQEDIFKFEKYFSENEQICTFWDTSRIETHTIFFAVKNNVDEIRREDFTEPERQDEYGTSVISIQFSKGLESVLKITNRYNHAVDNPDATFSNNLDNIYPGLTSSFQQYYGIKLLAGNKDLKMKDYVKANDGKFYKSNYAVRGAYYCENNIIIKDGEVTRYDKSRYEIVDYFIIDKAEKNIQCAIDDGFIKEFKNVAKIDILKDKETDERIFKITNFNNTTFEFKVNQNNKIVSYTNTNQKIMHANFLIHNKLLSELNIPKVVIIESCSLYKNTGLTQFIAPSLKHMQSGVLYSNRSMKDIQADNIQTIGDDCFYSNNGIESLNFKKLYMMGSRVLACNKTLKELYAPNLYTMGSDCLIFNSVLEKVNAPKLWFIGSRCLANHPCRKILLKHIKTHDNQIKYEASDI